ncbi:MAG: peptidoglycan editing factor PgeF [Thermodesulfobacteriota bacterium]
MGKSEILTRDALKYLSAPNLAGVEGLVHGFLTRVGGVSEAPFSSLNFGVGRGDVNGDGPEKVAANREVLEKAFNLPAKRLFTMKQVHSSSVLVLDGPVRRDDNKKQEADAVITVESTLPIGVLTADCVPVLLFDPAARAIGALHAGWRGAASGVIKNAVERMRREYAAEPGRTLAAIGPHIGPCCYHVGEDLFEEFTREGPEMERFFSGAKGSLSLDLGAAVANELTAAGLVRGNIVSIGPCTSCTTDLFFSYRKEGLTGRQLSFIMLM